MKFYKILVPILLLAFAYACEKDAFTPDPIAEDPEAVELRSPDVKVFHFTVRTSEVVENDGPGDPVTDCGTPATGYEYAHVTHLGQLRAEESTWYITKCVFDPVKLTMTNSVKGQWTAANGDKLFYRGRLVITLAPGPDGELVPIAFHNRGRIKDGTGRFDGAYGYFEGNVLESKGVLYVPK